MNTMDANALLRAYVEEDSEAAFQELVNRYINLVFSTALRRSGANHQLAEDVSQQVFTDLARKARSLPNNVMLGGWLHRHTGFVASNLMRAELRRQTRERKALEMNAINEPSQADWNQLAPVLDEAMDQLDSSDRDALVLRFFEQQDLRAVGSSLGITDDAAQKRVGRAVERLRELLVRRGSAILPVAALSLLLGTHSVQSAPFGLGPKIGKAALNAAVGAASAGLVATILNWLSPAATKIALAAVAAVILATTLVVRSNRTPIQTLQVVADRVPSEQATANSSNNNVEAAQSAQSQVAAKTSKAITTNGLHLVILAAGSGKPVPNALVELRGKTKNFFGDRAGNCYIDIKRDSSPNLELTTRVDGFADTRLEWRPDHGEAIPANYTLRLVRPGAIGGTVVDADDQPVADAKVGFNHEDDPAMLSLPENHEFTWIEVSTDTNGHWSINRIAPEMIHRIYGGASHPEHVGAAMVNASRDKDGEKQLREGTYVFHLGRAATVRGIAIDADGTPIADAKILVGKRGMSGSRSTTTGADGTFEVRGCPTGANFLTAEAAQFSATTMEVVLGADSAPFTVTLERGKVLRLRVVGQSGEPVAGAYVMLDTFHNRPINAPDYGITPVQANLEKETDKNGQMTWSNAPDAELELIIGGSGYMRKHDIKVRPDGEEHLITLSPALTVSGTVHDADTGQLIPRFKLITGWPQTNWVPDPNHSGKLLTKVEGHWSTIERYWVNFSGGTFKHVLEEPALYSNPNPGYVFKFEAEDYAPFISRIVAADEGHVQLDVAMHRATTRQISVILPDGSAAINTDIGLVVPGAHLQLIPGGFSRQYSEAGTTLLRTDTDGHFRLPGDPAITRVIAANPSGYAVTTPAALAENPILTMQPWGRLEGTYLSLGQPATNRNLLLQFTDHDADLGISFEFMSFKVATDAKGHFVFPQAPPGKLKIIYLAYVAPNGFAHQPLPDGDVEIRSGETTTKVLGGSGYTIKARARWPQGVTPDKKWHFFANAFSAPPQSYFQAANDPAALEKLQETPEIKDYTRKAVHLQAEVSNDYSITIENVPPGDYVISVMTFPDAPGEETTESLSAYSSVITVPTEPAFGTVDAGEITLTKPALAKGK
jgi:RNA polymerase sigma factor (sigma-70 family)